jgi:hypothetical protein
MTLQSKVDIYNKLLAGLSKGVKLAAVLQQKGDATEYKAAVKKNEELAQLAAKLRSSINKDWSIGATKVLADIQASSGKLQGQIREIEQTIAKGQKVVKALGYVDDLIEVAKAVAKAIA